MFLLVGSKIYAATGNGLFYSSNSGTSWTDISSGMFDNNLKFVTVNGTEIYAGTYSGVFKSTTNGVFGIR